jgi:diguanylate cyclase (GGDEF)-like protein
MPWHPRQWALWCASRSLVIYFLLVEAVAFAWTAFAMINMDSRPHEWGSLLALAVVAIGFEEGSRRVARLKIRLGAPMRADMTSVWAVAAAIALPAGTAAGLVLGIFAYDWFRHFRPAGEDLFRKLFVAATAVIGCLTAGEAFRFAHDSTAGLPWMLGGLVAVVAAIVTYTVTNRALVTVALLLMGARPQELIGSADENLVEVATLCLGGLTAFPVYYQPWMVVLVIPPMFTLQRGALMRELETAASTDAKTGLLNAVAWEHFAERELARAAREKYTLAVIIIDIDRFKRVNDRFGHLVGDQVLRRIGRAISAEVREYDGVGRFGGEEFVVLLPDVGAVEAIATAERIRARINQLRISDLVDGLAEAGDDLMSVSIGVSTSAFGADDVADLLRAADAALYRAKAEGRNRVVLADDGATDALMPTLSADLPLA